MKDPNAHTDSICIVVEECCVGVGLLSIVVDRLSKIIAVLRSSKCVQSEALNRISTKLTLSRYAVLNAISSLEATIKSIASSQNRIDENHLNSLLNIGVRLIECRNNVGEAIDEITELGCGEEVRGDLTTVSSHIDATLISVLALTLAITSTIKIDQNTSRRLSHVVASMLFTSLMSAHIDSVHRALSKCFYREVKILR